MPSNAFSNVQIFDLHLFSAWGKNPVGDAKLQWNCVVEGVTT